MWEAICMLWVNVLFGFLRAGDRGAHTLPILLRCRDSSRHRGYGQHGQTNISDGTNKSRQIYWSHRDRAVLSIAAIHTVEVY